MKYVVGAERTRWQQSNAVGHGRRAGDHARQRQPDGRTHAVDVHTRETVCGFPADELVLFEAMDWQRTNLIEKCVDCRNGVKS